jgi:preprotein translocase subunit YajC
MYKLLILLQAATQQPKSGNYMSILFLVLLILVFYLFFIRPASKRQKKQREYQDSLDKGSKIVTIGGIHGKILEKDGNTFVIETEGGSKLRIEKSAVNVEFANKQQ